MIYLWHIIGVWFLLMAGSGILAGDQISRVGRKMLPTAFLISIAYLVSLFFIY
jgi:hypothetical protein